METYSKFRMVEKISVDIFKPCPELILRHNVKLGSKSSQNGKKLFYHSEFVYKNTNYTDMDKLKSIRLSFRSYLTLEETNKDWTKKQVISIDYKNIVFYIKFFKKIYKWFTKKKYNDMYFYEDDVLKLDIKYKETKERLIVGNTALEARPYIIEKDNKLNEGIVLFINGLESFVKISFIELSSLYYILKNFDLYNAGMSLVNYLSRPEFDTNQIDMNSSQPTSSNSANYFGSKGMKNGDSKNNLAKDFFNKIK